MCDMMEVFECTAGGLGLHVPQQTAGGFMGTYVSCGCISAVNVQIVLRVL